jgi:hypothetical protein
MNNQPTSSAESIQHESGKAPDGAPPRGASQPITRRERNERWFEVASGIVLGIVAVATAWSGYQAATWRGVQSARYTQASAKRVDSTRESTLAGQHTLYDLSLFNQWLNAHASGTPELARIYERRFRPEFRPAFEAWLATDPFNNPDAPPGPLYMPQYVVSEGEQANQIASEADRLFAEGEAANQVSNHYVLNGVFLATCLFFIAIGERFEWMPVRVAILVMATGMLIYGLYHLAVYPIQ